jgi:SAM-dependent methyltransferase
VSEAFVPKLLGRSDYAIISAIIEPKARVLDLGCGEGELLAWLAENKRVDARGVEIEGSKVRQAISRGVSVFHSDIEDALADLPDQAFDYVILSQTLQESRAPLKVLREMLRVGRQRHRRVPQLRPLERAPGASVHRPRAQNQAVSARLVRFAQHPLLHRRRFRKPGPVAALDHREAHLPARRAADHAAAESFAEVAVFLVRSS